MQLEVFVVVHLAVPVVVDDLLGRRTSTEVGVEVEVVVGVEVEGGGRRWRRKVEEEGEG